MQRMKFSLFILISSFFVGCAPYSVPKVQIKEVYIPSKCEIDMPQKPSKSAEISKTMRDLMIYIEEMENALNFCVKGE